MTRQDLLKCVKSFAEKELGDREYLTNEFLSDASRMKRKIAVYNSALPEKEGNTKAAPYVLLQMIGGENEEAHGKENGKRTANIRAVAVLVEEEAKEGTLEVLGVLEKIEAGLRKIGILGKKYGIGKIEMLLYPPNSAPYYMGEMIIEFELPQIKRVDTTEFL